jgi:hypothetical protein
MTLTLEEGLSEGLKTQFIDEMVILHNLKNVTTSKTVLENKVNIKMSNPQMLDFVVKKINKSNVTITISDLTDTIIVLD